MARKKNDLGPNIRRGEPEWLYTTEYIFVEILVFRHFILYNEYQW